MQFWLINLPSTLPLIYKLALYNPFRSDAVHSEEMSALLLVSARRALLSSSSFPGITASESIHIKTFWNSSVSGSVEFLSFVQWVVLEKFFKAIEWNSWNQSPFQNCFVNVFESLYALVYEKSLNHLIQILHSQQRRQRLLF